MRQLKQTVAAALLLSASVCAFPDEVQIHDGDRLLNANLELAPGSSLEDGVILMLHGTLGHKDMEIMAALQSVFLEYAYNSLAINLSLDIDDRHGFYPCERPHTHEYGDAHSELDLWLAWLAEQDAGDIVLLGHSRGANQITNYLLQSGSKIRAAILLAPSAGDGSKSAEVKANLDRARRNEWLNEVDFLHCKDTNVLGTSYVSYYGSPEQGNTPELLESIATPVLVFSGSHDLVVTGLAEKMEGLNNTRVRHLELDGADHFFRDLFAYDVVEETIKYLDSLQVIEPATSLASDAQSSIETQRPIIVFISQHGCQFCQLLRDQVLHPMIRGGQLNANAILREVSLDAGFTLHDFAGKAVGGSAFAGRYDAEITPTLLFLDGKGRELTDRIVGISNIEYYGFYLDKAIASATSAIVESSK